MPPIVYKLYMAVLKVRHEDYLAGIFIPIWEWYLEGW